LYLFIATNPYNFLWIATAGPQDALHKNRPCLPTGRFAIMIRFL
jgi:hypothetical protein